MDWSWFEPKGLTFLPKDLILEEYNKYKTTTKTTTTKHMAKSTKTNSNDVLNYLVDYYEQFNSLPTPVIECTVSGTAYTCFGSNLKGKIERAGGIKELLTTFTGRGVIKKTATKKTTEATITPRKKKVITIKAQDLEKTDITIEDLTPVE